VQKITPRFINCIAEFLNAGTVPYVCTNEQLQPTVSVQWRVSERGRLMKVSRQDITSNSDQISVATGCIQKLYV